MVRRALVIAGARSLAALVALLVAVLAARVLNEDEWKALALGYVSIYQVASTVGSLGIEQTLFFFYPTLPSVDRRSFIWQSLGILFAMAVLSGAIIYAVVLAREDTLGVQHFVGWLALALVLEQPSKLAPYIALVIERPTLSAALGIGMEVTTALGLVVPLVAGLGLQASVQGLCVAAGIRLAVVLFIAIRFTPPGHRLRIQRIRTQLGYAIPLGLTAATAIVNKNIDRWYIATWQEQDFGAYAFASYEVPFVSMLAYAMGSVIATRVVTAFQSGRAQRALEYWRSAAARMSTATLPMVFAIFLVADDLIPVLFTDRYAQATFPFIIYNAILLYRIADYGLFLRAAGDTTSQLWVTLIVFATNATISIPLTLWFGMAGAATGTLLASVLGAGLLLRKMAAVVEVRVHQVFPWPTYLVALALSLVAAIGAYFAHAYIAEALGLDTSLAHIAVKVCLFAPAYVGLIVLATRFHHLPQLPLDDRSFVETITADPRESPR